MLGRIALKLSAVIALIIIGALWLAFFSARPPLATDPATLAGDGSVINYCALPQLDGSTTYMDRICELPGEHKTPKPRGLRLQFF